MPRNDVKERRRFVRITLETQISFIIASHQNISPHTGITQNISAGGIYITTNYRVKLGDQIQIAFDQNMGTQLTTNGTVVRCKFDKKASHLFHVSIKFCETQEHLIQSISKSMVMAATKYG